MSEYLVRCLGWFLFGFFGLPVLALAGMFVWVVVLPPFFWAWGRAYRLVKAVVTGRG